MAGEEQQVGTPEQPPQTGNQGQPEITATQLRQQFMLQVTKESVVALFAIAVLFCLIYLVMNGTQRVPMQPIPTAPGNNAGNAVGTTMGSPSAGNAAANTSTSSELSIQGLLQIVIPLVTLVFGYYSNKVSSDGHIQIADNRANAADARASANGALAANAQQRADMAQKAADILANTADDLTSATTSALAAHEQMDSASFKALKVPHDNLRDKITKTNAAIESVRRLR